MRILFLGDIVGRPGYDAVTHHLGDIVKDQKINFVVANAENAADGSGLTARQFKGLIEAGVHAVTMGDHIYKKMELRSILEQDPRIVKPANYPFDSVGRPWTVLRSNVTNAAKQTVDVAVISLMGRTYMRPVDCPFAAIETVLGQIPASVKVRIVDVHAEATSDKQMLGRFLNGRVSLVIGTHTHVPTADERILSEGTAYQTDAGMSGPYDSVIGRDVQRVLQTTITFEPVHFHVATDDVRLCGATVDIDVETGKATAIKRFEYKIK